MAVAVAGAPPKGTDVYHEIRFIVRDQGTAMGPGCSPQSQGNQGNFLKALEDAIVAGTIAVSGLELWRKTT